MYAIKLRRGLLRSWIICKCCFINPDGESNFSPLGFFCMQKREIQVMIKLQTKI